MIANGFEFYDIAVYSVIQTYVTAVFFPETDFGHFGYLWAWLPFILRFVSRPLGGYLVGCYADKYSRRSALILTSMLTGCGTLAMALLPSYAQIGIMAPLLFFFMQLIQAFSFAGEFPSAIAYLMETSKNNDKAEMGGMLLMNCLLLVAFAYAVVGILELFLSHEAMLAYGWRIPVLIGTFNIFLGYLFRRKMLAATVPISSKNTDKMSFMSVFKIFLITVPNSVLFYANTVSSKLIISSFTTDTTLRSVLPIVFNVGFALMCFYLGRLIDQKSNVYRAANAIFVWMIVSAVPVYWLQSWDNWFGFIMSQVIISLYLGVVLSITPKLIYDHAPAHAKTTTMGLGYNLAVCIVGAGMPLVVSTLATWHHAYIGVVIAAAACCYFIGTALKQSTWAINNTPAKPRMTIKGTLIVIGWVPYLIKPCLLRWMLFFMVVPFIYVNIF